MFHLADLRQMQSDLLQQNLGAVYISAPMCQHTTWRIGGPADLLFIPHSLAALQTSLQYVQQQGLPLTLLGCGSNILVSDAGLRGLVIKLEQGLNAIHFTEHLVTAQAGARLSDLAYQAAQHSLTGLAFAEGIPGSVGGAIVMNAGAYGGHIADCLQSVTYLTPDGQIHTMDCQSSALAYRSSVFHSRTHWIVSADFALTPGDQQAILAEMALYHQKRNTYQPLDQPSAGSVFKNPPGHKAARLIEAAGAKGWRIGDAQVSQKHCNFIINCGQATCQDVRSLISQVRQAVYNHCGIVLEQEVIVLGEI